jgi:hypothetical protein
LKLNYIGIVGGLLAFISLALPWWTLSEWSGMGIFGTHNWYLYNLDSYMVGMNSSYSLVVLYLAVLAGTIGLVGSIKPDGKKMLLGGGLLALLSIIIFPVGLQMDLSSHNATFGLFSNISKRAPRVLREISP